MTTATTGGTGTSYGSIDQEDDGRYDEKSIDITTNNELKKETETTPFLGKGTEVVEGDGSNSDNRSNNKKLNNNNSKDSKDRSWWSQLTFQWFSDILHRGNEMNRLNYDDLKVVPLPVVCTTEEIVNTFDEYWRVELTKAHPSLLRALVSAYGKDYFYGSCLKFIHDIALFVGPKVLHNIITYLRTPGAPLSDGIYLTVTITLSQILVSLCLRHYFFKCYMTGLRVRTAVVLAVYRKALLLSAAERQMKTLGQITNLMSIDAQRLQDLVNYMNSIWSSPLQIGLALYFLWGELGPSSLGGVAVIILMIPVTKFVATYMGGLQKKLMLAKDERIELNSEVLSGMKVIKLQAWEESFQNRIKALREKELQQLLKYYVLTAFSSMIWTFTPMAIALSTFAAYVWSGHDLDVASALTALALFNILRFPIFVLPLIINSIVEAMVSIDRIRSFLLCEEHSPIGANGITETGTVQMQTLSAVYNSRKPKLENNNKKNRKSKDSSSSRKGGQEILDRDWEISLLKSQLKNAEQEIEELSGFKKTATPRPLPSPWKDGNEEQFVPIDAVDTVDTVDTEEHQGEENLLALKRINFECKPGELIAIVGTVGCGKSSFVNAILGEVRSLEGGTTSVCGSLSYFSQSPFIMNATVRDNILFSHANDGTKIDEELYQRALKCCALDYDLELLPFGDQTEIGEKGITLSGGQKARVALARAVYHRGDITLIDDALSAVDAHVAQHLFEECIVKEFMNSKKRKRSVILVTNAIQYLNHDRVDKICVIQDGRIVETGTYKELTGNPESIFSYFMSVVDDTGVKINTGDGNDGDDAAVAGPLLIKSELDNTDNNGDNVMNKSPTSRQNKRMSSKSSILPKQSLMTEETRAKGHVGLDVYLSYANAAGGWYILVVILIIFSLNSCITVSTQWWLTYWSSHGGERTQLYFLTIYGLINLSSAFGGLIQQLFLSYVAYVASRKLFDDMLDVVLHAPMSFFDTTPVGRLVNRFSKDLYTIDEKVIMTGGMYLRCLFSVGSTIAVISGVMPMFLIFLIPLIFYYIREQAFFTVSYRELKRLDSTSRSPVYALLGESVDGVAVIRSFSAEDSLKRRLTAMLDRQQHAYYLVCAAQSWLAVRLELVGTLIITFACLSAVVERERKGADDIFAGLAGLAISYSLAVTQSLSWSVRMASDMEANMVAVERVKEYTEIKSEGKRKTPVDDALPHDWPSSGALEIKNAKLRYRAGLPLVLKGLNISIPAASKVGVVGRTGAGKSTLMIALLRIVELAEGDIYIDGQNTKEVGLAKLRSNIAVIPQDPVLYSGTVRTNLDPFDNFPNSRLYEVLGRVGLWTDRKLSSISLSSMASGVARVRSILDEVTEGGSNFSVGQRQLLVIARALLHGSKLVIMDEATAAVDAETDASIQKVMRDEFAKATVITVAHRINTIMDSDYILVMSDGLAAEFDTPKTLLEKKEGGLFQDLVQAAARDKN